MSIGSLLQSLFVRITADTSGVDRDLSGLGSRLTHLGDTVGKSMMGIGAGLTAGITAPLVALGVQSVQAASDVQEMNSAFGFTFGKAADAVRDWAETTGDAMGRSTQDLQQYSMSAMQLFSQAAPSADIAADMSKKFAALAVDLGSFFNVADDDAMAALRSGLTGEAEPLRRFGIFLNEAAVKAQALKMGLVPLNGELTDQQKIMARSQIILEATTMAQGDATRTLGSLANQQRAAKAAWEEATVSIGQAFLPIITQLATSVTGLLNNFNGLDAGTRNTVMIFAGIAAAIGPLLVGFGGLLTMLGTLAPMFAAGGTFAAGGALAGFGALLGPIAIAVAAVVGAFLLFKDDVIPVLNELREKMAETLGPAIEKMVATFKTLMEGPFGDAVRFVIDLLGQMLAIFVSVLGERVIAILTGLVEIVTRSFAIIGDIFKVFAALLHGDFAGAWNALKDLVGNVFMSMLAAAEMIIPGITNAMQRLVSGVKTFLVDQLKAIFDGVIEKIHAVEGAFQWLWDRVVGHSWVPDLVEDIGEWFGKLQGNMVDPANAAAAEVEQTFEGLMKNVGNVLSNIQGGNWGGAIGGIGNMIGGKWGGLLKNVGSIFDLFGGGKSKSSAYNTGSSYSNGASVASTPVDTSPRLTQIVQVHANDAVLAETVRGWVTNALQTANAAVPTAVTAALDLVPAEMGRSQSERFY